MTALYTPEGEALVSAPSAEIPWNVYPRPHLMRASFFCLNGIWEFGTVNANDPPQYTQTIRVPFPPESMLSGVEQGMPKGARRCYRRRFSLPDGWIKSRVLLHIDACDQTAEVFLNGTRLGAHRGGYERFSFDITEFLSEENELTVLAEDHLEDGILPYGKQRFKRGGMWYTPISGIWQSVWLESVPEESIRELRVKTNGNTVTVAVDWSGREQPDGMLLLPLPEGERNIPMVGGKAEFQIDSPLWWSPERPHLYRFSVRMGEDTVSSYFALRTLEICEIQGIKRLCLNGRPYFFHGLLDQGYFSDGIFLPASPEGYTRDIENAKKLGFNMLRKHIKTEPELFYYECDRLGIAVFQDMINNDGYSFLRDTALPTVGLCRRDDRRMHRRAESREAFLTSMKETVKRLFFHPSVVYWTIFNEGWGQFDHAAAYEALRAMDDSRWIDSVSGWFLPPKGRTSRSDVDSIHVYFKPVRFRRGDRPMVLSEFGGYAHKISEHSFQTKGKYGYRFFEDRESFGEALEELYLNEIVPAVKEGLCASVYTQLSDVEDEVNGLLTYDRRVIKVSEERMTRIAQAIHAALADQK